MVYRILFHQQRDPEIQAAHQTQKTSFIHLPDDFSHLPKQEWLMFHEM